MNRKRATVLTQAGHFAADADDSLFMGGQVASDIPVVLIAVRLRHQHIDVPAEDLLLAVTEQPLSRAIERFDSSALVDDDDSVDSRLDDGTVPRFAGSKSRFHPFVLAEALHFGI